MGILIMVGWLAGMIAIIWALVLRFDPEARRAKDQDEVAS